MKVESAYKLQCHVSFYTIISSKKKMDSMEGNDCIQQFLFCLFQKLSSNRSIGLTTCITLPGLWIVMHVMHNLYHVDIGYVH